MKEHCLHLGMFMSREVMPLMSNTFWHQGIDGTPNSSWRRGESGFNGTGTTARDIINALETLTCRSDVRHLTMTVWADLIPRLGLLRQTRAWCPSCYGEWKAAGQPIYDPLLWAIRIVTVCSQHKRLLRTTCPHHDCGQRNRYLVGRTPPGYCNHCGGWLGSLPGEAVPLAEQVQDHDLDWHRWLYESVGGLLAAMPDMTTPPSGDRVARAFQECIRVATKGDITAFARAFGLPKNTVWLWHAGKVLPQIDMLAHVCYNLDVPLHRFLLDDVIFPSNDPPMLARRLRHPQERSPARTIDWLEVQRQLEAILASDELPPPSPADIARRLGFFDACTLRRHFPLLCQTIAERWRLHRREQSARWLEERSRTIRDVMMDYHKQGVYPSVGRVAQKIGKGGWFRKPTLRKAWLETIRELGWKVEP